MNIPNYTYQLSTFICDCSYGSGLLQEGIYNVSEIAYKVGMNDPLYFSKCFKSHFGAPPSAYLHKK